MQSEAFPFAILPRLCLRQSLTLYRTLSQIGYPVEIHFGALKKGKDLYGHSWVTMHGEPLADTARSEIFKVVYSYLTISSWRAERSTPYLTNHRQKEAKMKKQINRRGQPKAEPSGPFSTEGKKRWQEPKLSFVKPKLTKHGKLEEVTGQFFGAFSPGRTRQGRGKALSRNMGRSALYALNDLVLELHFGRQESEEVDRLLEELSWASIRSSSCKPTLYLSVRPNYGRFIIPQNCREVLRTDDFLGFELDDNFFLTDGSSVFHLQAYQTRGLRASRPVIFYQA